MIRRSLRIGLTLGILAGVGVALTKLLHSRPGVSAVTPRTPAPASTQAVAATATPHPWPALTTDPAVPEAPSTALHPDPAAPEPRRMAAPAPAPWVEPSGSVCPTTHPVKGKLASKIFHLPGMRNYDRTNPDRCYRDAAAAEGDGLRPAKR